MDEPYFNGDNASSRGKSLSQFHSRRAYFVPEPMTGESIRRLPLILSRSKMIQTINLIYKLARDPCKEFPTYPSAH